jgi:hypothetical protein
VQLDPSSIRMVQIKITCFIKIVPFSSTLRRLTACASPAPRSAAERRQVQARVSPLQSFP